MQLQQDTPLARHHQFLKAPPNAGLLLIYPFVLGLRPYRRNVDFARRQLKRLVLLHGTHVSRSHTCSLNGSPARLESGLVLNPRRFNHAGINILGIHSESIVIRLTSRHSRPQNPCARTLKLRDQTKQFLRV